MARPNLDLSTRRLYVQITPQMRDQLLELAVAWNTTLSEITRQALRMYLQRIAKEAPDAHDEFGTV